jgi:hypothetical protein
MAEVKVKPEIARLYVLRQTLKALNTLADNHIKKEEDKDNHINVVTYKSVSIYMLRLYVKRQITELIDELDINSEELLAHTKKVLQGVNDTKNKTKEECFDEVISFVNEEDMDGLSSYLKTLSIELGLFELAPPVEVRTKVEEEVHKVEPLVSEIKEETKEINNVKK